MSENCPPCPAPPGWRESLRNTERRLAFVVVVACMAASVSAQNLITNPDFDTDVSGWSPSSSIDWTWQSDDYQGSPISGSGLAVQIGGTGSSVGIIQCIGSVSPGEYYRLSTHVDFPSGQLGEGTVSAFVWWYDGPACTGSQTTALVTPSTSSTAGWEQLSSAPEQAPAGTESVWVYLLMTKSNSNPSDFEAAFDGVELRALPEMIFADGFESGDVSRWALSPLSP